MRGRQGGASTLPAYPSGGPGERFTAGAVSALPVNRTRGDSHQRRALCGRDFGNIPKNPVNHRWYENRTTRQISILTAGMIIHPPVDRTCGPSGQMLEEEIKKKERGGYPTRPLRTRGEKRGRRP